MVEDCCVVVGFVYGIVEFGVEVFEVCGLGEECLDFGWLLFDYFF